MPGARHSLFVTAICLIAFVHANVSPGCPYCPRSNEATLCERLASADIACIVKFVESKNGEELSMQTTTFQIEKLMKPFGSFKKNDRFVVSFGQTAKKGDPFLIMGQMQDNEMEWSLPIPLDELWGVYRYLDKAPSPERPADQRLSYFLKYLDNENQQISNDAFDEFARARFEDVVQIVPQLSRDDLRRWLNDPNPQLDPRRAFYAMLLGLCGNSDDARFLEQKIFAPIDPTRNRLGIDGMMGGYLILKREAGLKKLVEQKVLVVPKEVDPSDPRLSDMAALKMTLNFLWDFRRQDFTEDSLRTAMRAFLDRPEFADLAIIDLARWKDWTPLDRLIGEYGHEPWDTKSQKAKVVAYVLSCRKDAPPDANGKLPAHAVKAQEFLDSLDPEFVESVRSSTSGRRAVLKPASGTKGRDDSE